MSTGRPDAISGVSSEHETLVMSVYPSIGGTALGRALGGLYESLPLPIYGIKLSHLLFPLPTSPLAVAEFFRLKLTGDVYCITNRSVQIRKSLGNNLVRAIPLSSIASVVVDRDPQQAFYKSGNLSLRDQGGAELMELVGVPYPDVFRQTILEAVEARRGVELALGRIQKRPALA